ncbi:MAG: NAD(+) synthase [Candidatus Borkfalkiaceae bacterium]|nr:NAD(+) synthase [Clostridia bacterium]MDY6223584.1 NAD(+) synthase [Christensenellaceae bacterium]
MKYGFVKAAALSPEVKVADVKANVEGILNAIKKLAREQAEVAAFPELSLCGYTCGDLFFSEKLLSCVEEAAGALAEEAAKISKNLLFFVGLPVKKNGALYNCAAAICGGKILALIPKTALPNYNEFYERRYFTPAEDKPCETVTFAGQEVLFGRNVLVCDKASGVCVACEICEDLWVTSPPSQSHAAAGAQIVVNLSASNETVGKAEYRRSLIKSASGRCLCAYVYADAGEGESVTDSVFAGHCLIAENGEILSESKLFSKDGTISEIDAEFLNGERRRLTTFTPCDAGYTRVYASFIGEGERVCRKIEALPFVPLGEKADERKELILSLQSHALARRLSHVGAKRAVIGVSGGLDSTLALLVTARAFDLCGKNRSEILAVSMPGFGTSEKTLDNSLALPECLGAEIRKIPIKKVVEQHFKDVSHDPAVKNVTYENAQARARTYILMDLANECGGIVVGTGDLSELALGWCTYNGDHMSMYGVNSGVPKTLVRHLAEYEGRRIGGETQKVIEKILATEISPELLPPDEQGNIVQKTEDIVGPYELHDFFLYRALRRGDSPKKIFYLAKYAFGGKYGDKTLVKWLKNFYKRFFSQQFKRSCMPDGVKVGSVTLSPRADFRMPSDASAELWLRETEEIERSL